MTATLGESRFDKAVQMHDTLQMNLWIGTSGFQYPEWRGTFYPEKFSTTKMLPYYSERFSSTEVNYTFHRIPSGKTIETIQVKR